MAGLHWALARCCRDNRCIIMVLPYILRWRCSIGVRASVPVAVRTASLQGHDGGRVVPLATPSYHAAGATQTGGGHPQLTAAAMQAESARSQLEIVAMPVCDSVIWACCSSVDSASGWWSKGYICEGFGGLLDRCSWRRRAIGEGTKGSAEEGA